MEINRRFCIEFAIIFMVIALLTSFFVRDNFFLFCASLLLFGGLLIVTIVNPLLLRRPAKGWLNLGRGLAFVMNPIILFLLYFGFLFPYSIILKLRKHKPIDVAFDKNKSSYWSNLSKASTTDLRKQY